MSISSVAGAQLPAPTVVPGKEYSDHVDVDQSQVIDPLQNLFWDGLGGNVDAFDYSGSGPPPEDPDQVDALANEQDYLFFPLLNNQSAMIISLDQENFLRNHNPTGATGVWATPLDVRSLPASEVDAVELWGDPSSPQHDGLGGFDANHYSYIGDFIAPVPPGGIPPISIFHYDPFTHVSKPYIFHDPLRDALNQSFGFGLDQIDVDALMVYDLAGDTEWNVGDWIIFSLRPVSAFPMALDGGELFVWQNGQPIVYLQYGGRTWDTLNPVAQIFNANTENIDALESVTFIPEPATAPLTALWLALFMRRCRSPGSSRRG
jgi:hypothetical protein